MYSNKKLKIKIQITTRLGGVRGSQLSHDVSCKSIMAFPHPHRMNHRQSQSRFENLGSGRGARRKSRSRGNLENSKSKQSGNGSNSTLSLAASQTIQPQPWTPNMMCLKHHAIKKWRNQYILPSMLNTCFTWSIEVTEGQDTDVCCDA
jgi:hypothetical protein